MADADDLEKELDAIQMNWPAHRPSIKEGARRSKKKTVSIGQETVVESISEDSDENSDIPKELKYIDENVVGRDTCFHGPYGERQVIYCDYTASGRALKFIEDYITHHVHPVYANTHTTTGLMARQTTQFRKEARQIIKKCVNANEDYALIFTGSGTTAAVHKLVTCMELRGERAKKSILFVGPYEHHSNILPWKESGARVVRIRDTEKGLIDMDYLEEQLQYHQKKKRLLIGCFSAASNVTGILSDTHTVATLLHKYGALSFWDYATAGPYMKIDMNPEPENEGDDPSKDAVYLSPHKFVGGVGTPGILIARKNLFINAIPGGVGGGTVSYVTRDTHVYIKDIEEREEGGTPAIVESIRAGLTFQIKESVGTQLIEKREHELTKLAFQRWRTNPNLIFLGSTTAERLPIFAFLIVHPNSGKVLHHNFIAVLLNDLYGIQARGGCACAGPYAQDLLGIDEDLAKQFTYFLVPEEDAEDIDADEKETKDKKNRGNNGVGRMHRVRNSFRGKRGKIKANIKRCPIEIMKPGFCRLNLPFFFDDEVIDYILEAVDNLATYGWRLLPQFTIDIHSGTWTNNYPKRDEIDGGQKRLVTDSLMSAQFVDGKFRAPPSPFKNRKSYVQSAGLQKNLEDAMKIFQEASQEDMISDAAMEDALGNAVGDEKLVWFLRPHEALWHLQNPGKSKSQMSKINKLPRTKSGKVDPTARANNVPFKPKRYARYTLRLSRKSKRKQQSATSGLDNENHNTNNDRTSGEHKQSRRCCIL
ncbi:uncharacterized protein [Amphiura filiformis]|uniref:uncharacterized protein isoform X2 n=1 Tax=Amphiura filiformis TaxID=82378 RepID=UPI003B20C151